MTDEKLFTRTVKCTACKKELHRVEHIPVSRKFWILVGEALASKRCKTKHPKSTRGTELGWEEET